MNMLNSLALDELERHQMREIDGGSFIKATLAGIVIASVAEIIQDWDNFKAGLRDQPPQ